MTNVLFAILVASRVTFAAPAQTPGNAGMATVGDRLLRDATIAATIDRVQREEPAVLEEQRRLCEVPAPPFGEARRAAVFKARFEALGLTSVRIDKAGNVIGERRGAAARPHVVLSAHLDTVFPEETPVATSRAGDVLRGPGISDDCRGLAVLLAVARALTVARVQTTGRVTFVGTVGEEGLGDLRGVRHLFDAELPDGADAFVSVDGAGMGVTNTAVGSLRYRVTFKGPGGHSYGNFGIANPMHALGRAVARIADLQVPSTPRTTFNVGRIGGGTSVNTIPSSAWMEVDLRSSDRAALRELDAGLQRALDAGAADENRRWGGPGVVVEKTSVGDRPAGRTPPEAPIVEAALSVTRAVGERAVPGEGSTDANLPISRGVPAITIGGGGTSDGEHTVAETFTATGSWKGTARALLLVLALAGR